jgi:hypothetical protein
MATQAGNARKFWIAGGALAVIGVVGMIAIDYPPGTQDTAGTIVPAKRFRADGGGASILGDSTATQQGVNVASGVNSAAADAARNASFDAARDASADAARDAAADSARDASADAARDASADAARDAAAYAAQDAAADAARNAADAAAVR